MFKRDKIRPLTFVYKKSLHKDFLNALLKAGWVDKGKYLERV